MVAWRWAAARDHAGQWGLASLLIGVGESTDPYRHRYPEAIIASEALSGRAAAGRLRRGVLAPKRWGQAVAIPTQTQLTGQWLFSEESWRLVNTAWPHFTFSGGVGPVSSYDLSVPLQAAGQPYFASLSATIAERVFGVPADEMEHVQAHQVLVRIPDRRARIEAIDANGGDLLVTVTSGTAAGLTGVALRAVWRSEPADVAWHRHDEDDLGDQPVRLPTQGVPTDFVVALVAPDGHQVDRRSWDERFGRPEEEHQPASLDGLVLRWLGEGEHQQLEYKRELTKNRPGFRWPRRSPRSLTASAGPS